MDQNLKEKVRRESDRLRAKQALEDFHNAPERRVNQSPVIKRILSKEEKDKARAYVLAHPELTSLQLAPILGISGSLIRYMRRGER